MNIGTISGRVLVRAAKAHGRAVTPRHLREAQRLTRLFEAEGADPWTAAQWAADLVLLELLPPRDPPGGTR